MNNHLHLVYLLICLSNPLGSRASSERSEIFSSHNLTTLDHLNHLNRHHGASAGRNLEWKKRKHHLATIEFRNAI